MEIAEIQARGSLNEVKNELRRKHLGLVLRVYKRQVSVTNSTRICTWKVLHGTTEKGKKKKDKEKKGKNHQGSRNEKKETEPHRDEETKRQTERASATDRQKDRQRDRPMDKSHLISCQQENVGHPFASRRGVEKKRKL